MRGAVWPTGTVTFLFTDIVGSTRLWEVQPDMDQRVAAHLATLRAVVSEHHGVVFSEMGDGIAAAFSSAHDAAHAAMDAQRAPSDGVITARMAIHTGDAVPRDNDYFGTPVNRCARVMAVAHGGQIVLTQSSAELLRLSPIDDVELLDLGLHRLRDLSDPEHLWQIGHPSLVADFPRVRSLDYYRGNLPAQRTKFIRRNDLLVRLDKLLLSRRLVTLTGVGGAGKTRLALQAAADALPRFPGGAWLVDHPLEVWCSEQGVHLARQATRELDNWRDAVMFTIQCGDATLAPRFCRHLLGGDEPETARWAESLLAATNSTEAAHLWMHWVAATGLATMLEIDACESHLRAFDLLAKTDAERAWNAVPASTIAEVRDQRGAEVLRQALQVQGLEAAQRAFMLIVLALFENIPPNRNLAAAAVAVAEAERLGHYATPLAHVVHALALAGRDDDKALSALARAEALADDHPSAFIRASVAGWGSLTLVGLPTSVAAEHLLLQTRRLQQHWTNVHIGFLATCTTVLQRTHEAIATRSAAYLLAQAGTEMTVRRLCPDLDTASLPPSTDDLDTIMSLVREALAELRSRAHEQRAFVDDEMM